MFVIRAGFSLALLTNRGIALRSSAFLLSWVLISTAAAQNPQVIDGSHFSNVLGEVRKYRVYLPSDYYDSPEKQYPVIYFYHGWSQRYFGSKEAKSESDSQLSDEEKIAVLGSKYGVIVVKPDGYNRRPNEPYYLRPYNIGPVETHRQFPHYFPELVEYIDANYRTIAERAQRGITGFSMGGFMSFWVAGKYPHLVSAAGSFCGSAEFVIGPVDFPVEYFHGDMYGNYEGLKLRLHHGENDFIRAYHRDIDRIWKQVMDNYESRQYPGRHELVGLEDMFQFFEESFDNPADVPSRWNHIDVYPEFSVWDYEVSSDRDFPGFTVLENVDKQGFKISVRSQHPKGETLPRTKLSITTAPLYGINTDYQVTIFDLDNNKKTQSIVRSDHNGQIKIYLNGGNQEVGIHKPSGKPNIAISTVVITSGNYSACKTHTPIEITLINKGGSKAEGITAELIGSGSAELEDKIVQVGDIGVLSTATVSPLVFHIPSDSIGTQKFTLKLKDRNNNEWQEDFVLHLKPKGKPIERFEIADGREVTFLKGGKDTVSMVLGVGNGDGIPNPGESIVVLVKDGGINRLTSLHSFSPIVDLKSSHTRVSDSWSNFDHVGGSFKYSRPVISSNLEGETDITLYAEYWIPEYPDHHIKGGEITLKVSGEDKSAPQLNWAYVKGDNIFQAKFYDGGKIVHAEVTLRSEENPDLIYNATLNDQGKSGDRSAEDGVFSQKIEVKKFGLYNAEVVVIDELDNKGVYTIPEKFIFHEVDLFHEKRLP